MCVAATRWATTDGELDESMLPTAAGLYARTTEQWSDPSFLELSETEMRELFPIDENIPAFGGGNVADLIGGLPTREDCDAAMRNQRCRSLLSATCAAELLVSAMASVPAAQRTPEFERDREMAVRRFRESEEALMDELDYATTFKDWRLLWRLYAKGSANE